MSIAPAVAAGAIAIALTTRDSAPSSAPMYSRGVVGHKDGQPVVLQLVSIGGGYELDEPAGVAFSAMRVAAEGAGVEFKINSAFRTYEQQQALRTLYEQGKGNLAALPGYSNHEDGRAVDLESAGGTNAAFYWLTSNAFAFHFRRAVASEPWHWEYFE